MTTQHPEEVRRQFEAAMKEKWGNFIATRYDHGYAHDPENCAWEGYQAALQSPAVRGVVEACRKLIKDSYFMREEYSDMNKAVDQAEDALRTLGAGHVE